MNLAIQVNAPSVAAAWAGVCRALLQTDGHAAFHVVTRIGNTPVAGGQDRVDELLARRGYQPTETVANTIFPAALAARCADVNELAKRYLAVYPRLRTHPKNKGGTYFGRLVSYPGAASRGNQLGHVVEKLKRELDGLHKSSIYECAVYHPEHDAGKAAAFPCMSSCAFHLDANDKKLYLVAHYRNQHLVERGYGNYLGLARLRDYVASQVGLSPAELMIVAGHARLDCPVGPIEALLARPEFAE